MATIRLTASTYSLSNTSYLRVTSPENLYKNTDNNSYTTVQNTQSGTTSYYIYIKGFNFSAIPAGAIVNSFTVKVRARMTGISTSTSYRPYLCNNTTTITGNCNTVTTTDTTLTFTGVSASFNTIKSYGSNFGIRLCNRRSSRNTASYLYIYGAEILVDYTIPKYYNITTSADGCSVSPDGVTEILENESIAIRFDADRKPVVTDNGVDVSHLLVSKDADFGYSVNTAQGASYGFSMNSSGYYESTNKGKATTAAVSVVEFDLPVECTAVFSVINYAESTYDYGLLGNIDTVLSNSASADTSGVFWSGKNNNSASVQTVTYTIPAGTHRIYVKYFKDSYTDSNNDTLQFNVSVTPNEDIVGDTYYEYTISNVTTDHTIIAVMSTAELLFCKENGVWIPYRNAYKKINGTWVLQTDWYTLFQDGVNYVQGD